MELVVKILTGIIVFIVVSVLIWSYAGGRDVVVEEPDSKFIYYSTPITMVYVADASGNPWNYWKRFYSS
jgi:hypothetical protein